MLYFDVGCFWVNFSLVPFNLWCYPRMSDKQYSRTGTQVLYASAIGSVISTIVSNPIEVAKLNLQFFPLICPQYPHPSYSASN
jgi:hypothetical protein